MMKTGQIWDWKGKGYRVVYVESVVVNKDSYWTCAGLNPVKGGSGFITFYPAGQNPDSDMKLIEDVP